MKYLFFDIECSNCFNSIGKMCEIGYVLCDEKFKIIKSEDIYMSPGKGSENRFHLINRKNSKDISLSKTEDFYFKQPEFNHFYNQIKQLFFKDDLICFCFGLENDVLFLHHAFLRYKFDPINYKCLGIDSFFNKYFKIKQRGLDYIYQTYCENKNNDLINHNALDDAYKIYALSKEISIKENKQLLELFKEYDLSLSNSIEFSNQFIKKIKNKRDMKRVSNYYKQLTNLKISPYLYAKANKYYIVIGTFNSSHYLRKLISKLKSKNAILINNIKDANYIVTYDENNLEKLKEYINKYSIKGKIITSKEILEK